MKLSKKHIGKLFDNHGADGSWAYQLIDVKKDWLLFAVVGNSLRFEAQARHYSDWRPFEPQWPIHHTVSMKDAWARARKTP